MEPICLPTYVLLEHEGKGKAPFGHPVLIKSEVRSSDELQEKSSKHLSVLNEKVTYTE
jgi:hypothetical protein